jgi:hypothetical protein
MFTIQFQERLRGLFQFVQGIHHDPCTLRPSLLPQLPGGISGGIDTRRDIVST